MHDNTILTFEEPRDFSGAMNATYFFLKQNFKSFSKSLLLIAGPAVLLAGVFTSEIINRMINVAQASGPYSPAPYEVQDYFTSGEFFLQLFAALIFLLIGGVLTISTTYAHMLAYKAKQSTDIQLPDVWHYVKQLFWTNFANVFLYYIGMMIGFFVLAIPLFLIMAVVSLIHPLFGSLFGLAYYAGIIFLIIYFSMVFIITNYEKTDFFTALGRLFKLSKGKFWSIIGVGGINFYIQSVLSILFLIPWYVYIFLTYMHSTNGQYSGPPSFLNETVISIFMMIYFMVNILLYSLPLVALAFHYFSLMEFKEARGLMIRLKTFGEQPSLGLDHEDL